MDITRKNYEAYFIDYIEGNLDVRLVDRFIEFLQENPDLKEELMLFQSVTAVPENTEFTGKKRLYKEKYDLEEEFNQAAVASLEGDLDSREKQSFENYLNIHPEKNKELGLFSKTILQADESVRFEHKNKLYKKPARKVVLLWAGRVAAVLILALAVFSLVNKNTDSPTPGDQLAQVEQNTEVKSDISSKDITNPEVPVQEIVIEKTAGPENLEIQPKTFEKKIKQVPLETIQDKIQQENLIAVRTPVEVPGLMNTLTALLDVEPPKAELGTVTLIYIDEAPDDEHLLIDHLRGKFSLQKIAKAGLNLVTSLSNERFTYETNKEGKVIEYNYDSRLLAFSIPNSRTEPK